MDICLGFDEKDGKRWKKMFRTHTHRTQTNMRLRLRMYMYEKRNV